MSPDAVARAGTVFVGHPSTILRRLEEFEMSHCARPMRCSWREASIKALVIQGFGGVVRLQDRLSACSELIFNPFYQPKIFLAPTIRD